MHVYLHAAQDTIPRHAAHAIANRILTHYMVAYGTAQRNHHDPSSASPQVPTILSRILVQEGQDHEQQD